MPLDKDTLDEIDEMLGKKPEPAAAPAAVEQPDHVEQIATELSDMIDEMGLGDPKPAEAPRAQVPTQMDLDAQGDLPTPARLDPSMRINAELTQGKERTAAAVGSGVELLAKNVDRIFRPLPNAAFSVASQALGQHPEERFDWGKGDYSAFGPFSEIARGAAMASQAFGRGFTNPISAENPGQGGSDSVTEQELYAMLRFQEDIAKNPQLYEQHPKEIFGMGLVLALRGPSVLRYMNPNYVTKIAQQYNLIHAGEGAARAETELIKAAKSAEVRSKVGEFIAKSEAANRELEAANYAKRGMLGKIIGAPVRAARAIGDAAGPALAGASAKASDVLSRVPYFNAETTALRERAAAEKAVAKMGEGWKPAADAVGQAKEGTRHAIAMVLPGGYTLGTGHISPRLNTLTYEALETLARGLEDEKAYGEAAKLATTWALKKANYRGVVPQKWIDTVGETAQKLGDVANSWAQSAHSVVAPVYGHKRFDAQMAMWERLGRVRQEEAKTVSGSYRQLQKNGAEALGMKYEDFAEQVARCESREFYAQADPIVQRTFDMWSNINGATTKWMLDNGFERQLLDETGDTSYFMHMATPEYKEYLANQKRIGAIASTKKGPVPAGQARQFGDRDKLGMERKLMLGDGTAWGINEELKNTYGVKFNAFSTDPADVLDMRTQASARTFNNHEFVAAVKNNAGAEGGYAKRTGWDREETPEGFVGKRVTGDKGQIERVFIKESAIDDIAKKERAETVARYRDARNQLRREHKGTVAQRADDTAAAKAKTPEALEQEMRLQGAYGANDPGDVTKTMPGAGTVKLEQPNIVKVGDLFPEAADARGAEKTVVQVAEESIPPPPSPRVVKRALYQYDQKKPIARQLGDLRKNMAKEIQDGWARFLKQAKDDGVAQDWARMANDKVRDPGLGWKASKNPAFKGYAFPDDIANEIDKALVPPSEFTRTDRALNFAGKTYDSIAGWFRAQALLTPRYHIRNMIGNEYNKLIFTGLDSSNVAAYTQAHAMSWATELGKRDMRISAPLFKGTTGELDDILRERGVIGQSMMEAETSGVNAAFRGNRWLASRVENQGRRQMVIHELMRGKSLEQAIDNTWTTMFDYARRSGIEKSALSRLAYFYGWTRNNVPYQLEMFVKQPMRQMTIPILVRNMREFYGRQYRKDEGIGDLNSKYLIDKMGVPIYRDSNGIRQMLLAGESIPLENVNLLLGPLNTLLAGQPGSAGEMAEGILAMGPQPFKALIEATFNFDTFFGNTIDKLRDEKNITGVRTPTKMLGVTMTATEKHLAKMFVLAKWMDDLAEISGPEVYRSKPWFIRVLKAAGVSVQELDPVQETRRQEKELKAEGQEAERQKSNAEDKLRDNKAPATYDSPMLIQQRENIQRLTDILRESKTTSGRPW